MKHELGLVFRRFIHRYFCFLTCHVKYVAQRRDLVNGASPCWKSLCASINLHLIRKSKEIWKGIVWLRIIWKIRPTLLSIVAGRVPPGGVWFTLFVQVCVCVFTLKWRFWLFQPLMSQTAEAVTYFKHSLLESCFPLCMVRMSMKAETLIPLVFSPASNRVYG